MRKTIILKTCAGRALGIAVGVMVLVLLMAGGVNPVSSRAISNGDGGGGDGGGVVSPAPTTTGGGVSGPAPTTNGEGVSGPAPTTNGGGVSGPGSATTLSITATPTIVTADSPTDVTFTVTSAGNPVSDATVTLTGAATGGSQIFNGRATITVNAVSAGTITATAIEYKYVVRNNHNGPTTIYLPRNRTIALPANGTADISNDDLSSWDLQNLVASDIIVIEKVEKGRGSTTITATAPAVWALRITATPTRVTAGSPTDVTFIVTSAGNSVSGAAVTLAGAATGSGTTGSDGKAIISVNAANAGTITATASKSRLANGNTTIIAVAPTPELSITATPETVYFGSSVTFTVTSAGIPVSGAEVQLRGTYMTTGTTDNGGKITFFIQLPSSGFIPTKIFQETAVASKQGFKSASTKINITSPTPALNITATADTITADAPTWMTFTVTNRSDRRPVSGAAVSLSGAASGRGTTDRNGEVNIVVNAASPGIITVTANKTGIPDGSTTIIATGPAVPAAQTLSTTGGASPTIITLQGKLTDSSGNPVQTGSMNVTIKDSSGAQVWQETFNDVIDNGVFNIPLGAIQELRLVPNRIYSMEVAIDADSRKLLTVDVTFGDNSPAGDVIKFKA